MLYFLEKKIGKLLKRWGLRPQTPDGHRRLGVPPPESRVVTPVIYYSYFLKGVCSANVITVKKERKKLRNISHVMLFSHFFLQTLRRMP